MRDAARRWPPREESLFLRFQPVFTAQGQVHEYAVADSITPLRSGSPGLMAQRARLRAAVAFAAGLPAPLDLSFEHALTVPDGTDVARRLCADLDISVSRDHLCLGPAAGNTLLQLATRRLTFSVPLFRRLLPQAHLLACHTEFRASLRARLLPASCGGKPVASGVMRVTGLTLRIPRGLGADRALQRRFDSLMECATAAKLQVTIDDIEDMHDFVWLRPRPGLLFRGTVLSAPISAQCLDVWLQADGDAWRSFHACTARPSWTER
ncbi:hypothetical protein ACOTCN_25540 [Achromobacter xylosoxidans]